MEGTRTLRIVVLREIPEDPSLRREWNALVDRVGHPQVFYTYEWALAVQRAYGTYLQPLIVLAYDDGDSLAGVAALAVRTPAGDVTFLCASTGDYCDFLCTPDRRDEFTDSVLGKLGELGIKSITLTNLPADSNTLTALQRG